MEKVGEAVFDPLEPAEKDQNPLFYGVLAERGGFEPPIGLLTL